VDCIGFSPCIAAYVDGKIAARRLSLFSSPDTFSSTLHCIALQDRLRVLQLLGVVRFVSFGGQPASLPDREVETLRAGLKENIYAEPHPYLTAGRRVQVIRGPFLGTHGILIRRKDKFRVVISLALITRAVSVEVDASDVQPLL